MMIIRGAQSESAEIPAVARGLGVVPQANPLHARAAEEFSDEVATGRKPSIRVRHAAESEDDQSA